MSDSLKTVISEWRPINGGSEFVETPSFKEDADRIEELERQLADANAHVAALTAALTTRRSACNEESERADEAERQLDEALAALANCVSLVELKFGNTDDIANAAIEQARAAQTAPTRGWQPISTAPAQEDCPVDLWCVIVPLPEDTPEIANMRRLGFRVADAEWRNGEWWSNGYTLRLRTWIPTHWRPLPEPPNYQRVKLGEVETRDLSHGLVYPRSPTTGNGDEP